MGGAQEALKPKPVSDSVVEVFGRHNPPHLGHGLTMDFANDIAQNEGADQRFYSSKSQDPKKNPLPFQQKLGFLKELFPQHAEKWDGDESIRTVLGAATKAHQDGYKNFHFVGGGDRKQSMEDLLRRYNGNLFEFDNIYSHNAGDRLTDDDDPDKLKEIDQQGMGDKAKDAIKQKMFMAMLSASKMRGFAQNGNMEEFAQGLGNPKGDLAKRLFDAVQMYSQKNEAWEYAPRYNQEIIREMYREGELYQVGDLVESLSSGLIGRVHRCGTNHLICVTEDGIMFKNFIHDVQFV